MHHDKGLQPILHVPMSMIGVQRILGESLSQRNTGNHYDIGSEVLQFTTLKPCKLQTTKIQLKSICLKCYRLLAVTKTFMFDLLSLKSDI